MVLLLRAPDPWSHCPPDGTTPLKCSAEDCLVIRELLPKTPAQGFPVPKASTRPGLGVYDQRQLVECRDQGSIWESGGL